MTKRARYEFDKDFGEENFEKGFNWILATTPTHKGPLRLLVEVYPTQDVTLYRVERDGETLVITSKFKSALKSFRGLL